MKIGTPEHIPAIGYSLLYGPTSSSVGEKGVYKGRTVNNSTNLKLNSFHPVSDDSYIVPDPPPDSSERMLWLNVMGPIDSHNQAWNVARGNGVFNWPYYNPYEEKFTQFPFDGDPINQTGWYAYGNTKESNRLGGGAGFMFFSEPFNLAVGETQWAMIALVPALGEDNFDSITKLKNKVDELRSLPYDSLAISNRVVTSVDDDNEKLPLEYNLKQNYPNPFNPTTKIEYSIPEQSQVKIEVFNLLGQKIATLLDAKQNAGKHSVTWDASNIPSGVYFYQITVGSFINTKKMILLR
ncbi:MAG: T9SS type A sorting domain-containing protein [Melioribacteraceae bacterium]|nr:T9SS type A sorting domain-containing protein [Melioribacteraceae bacterium]